MDVKKLVFEADVDNIDIKPLLKKEFLDTITTMDFLTNKMYCKIANISWAKNAKRNGINKSDIIEE